MRILFTPPSENEFKQLFLSSPLRKGGGLEDTAIFQPKGIPYRCGSGVLSFISGVAKKILPFIWKTAKPAAKEFGSNVDRDVLNKKALRRSLKKNGLKAVRKTGVRLIRGSGKVQKKRRNVVKKKMKKTAGLSNYISNIFYH